MIINYWHSGQFCTHSHTLTHTRTQECDVHILVCFCFVLLLLPEMELGVSVWIRDNERAWASGSVTNKVGIIGMIVCIGGVAILLDGLLQSYLFVEGYPLIRANCWCVYMTGASRWEGFGDCQGRAQWRRSCVQVRN
jgi:hypothetical protein